MPKYRKKPVVIDAFVWSGNIRTTFIEPDIAYEFKKGLEDGTFVANEGSTLSIKTLEGFMTAQAGDWIIRGIKGEYYPCKPDIFEKTYELASE